MAPQSFPVTAHLPQVILSACDSQLDRAEALAAGADRYLAKPADTKALVDLVNGLLEQPCPASDLSWPGTDRMFAR